MFNWYYLPYCNREVTRKVKRYMKKHPTLTFTQAYNKLYHTDYRERNSIEFEATTINWLNK